MKLFSILLLLVSLNTFAQDNTDVQTGEGLLNVHNLHCNVELWPEKTETTVLNHKSGRAINDTVGLESELLMLEHVTLMSSGCNEALIYSIIEDSRKHYMHAAVSVKVERSIVNQAPCYDLLTEELSVTFLNGLTLKSVERKKINSELCEGF